MVTTALTAVAAVLAARHVKIGVTPADVISSIRVVDVKTGETIDKVIEADVDAGKVSRYATVAGNFILEGNAFKVIDEDREIRIEAIEPPAIDAAGEAEAEADEHAA